MLLSSYPQAASLGLDESISIHPFSCLLSGCSRKVFLHFSVQLATVPWSLPLLCLLKDVAALIIFSHLHL